MDHKLEELVTSLTAQLQDMQTRLLHVAVRGRMSDNMRDEITAKARNVLERMERHK